MDNLIIEHKTRTLRVAEWGEDKLGLFITNYHEGGDIMLLKLEEVQELHTLLTHWLLKQSK